MTEVQITKGELMKRCNGLIKANTGLKEKNTALTRRNKTLEQENRFLHRALCILSLVYIATAILVLR